MVVPQNYDKNGNVTSVLFANRGMTDEKCGIKTRGRIAGSKLKAECANKAKSSFLFNMSHDIRTPMNAIMVMQIWRPDICKKQKNLADTLKKFKYAERTSVVA